MRILPISPTLFPMLHGSDLRCFTIDEQQQEEMQLAAEQTVLFTNSRNTQTVLAYIEARTFIGEEGSGQYLIHVGRMLRDVQVWLPSEHEGEVPVAMGYYKHFNGVGRWVRLPQGEGVLPAMIPHDGLDGNLFRAQRAEVAFLHGYVDRPGQIALVEAPDSSIVQPRYEIEATPGHYLNLFAPNEAA